MRATTILVVAPLALVWSPNVRSLYGTLGAPERQTTSNTAADSAGRPSKSRADFRIDGSRIPLLNVTLQDSYAGRLALTNELDELRNMFFWYWPTTAQEEERDTLTIWLNGGPGCSSLLGLLNEIGPFLVDPNQSLDFPDPDDLIVLPNQYAWSTVSDMLFVEQPVGVGFSKGPVDVKNEWDVARDFYQFLQQFYTVFPELLQKKLYIAGESYAGFYIPYIAQRIFNATETEKKDLPINLQGLIVNDGIFSDLIVGQWAPLADFITFNQDVLELNDTTIANVREASQRCGFDDLMSKLQYPPNGPILLNNTVTIDNGDCFKIVQSAWDAAMEANPCFNIDLITDKCPRVPNQELILGVNYWVREDVTEIIHVEGEAGKWRPCAKGILRDPDDNTSTDPSPYTDTLIPALINELPRGMTIWHGDLDMILIANGTLLSIQGMTWGGKQGFQEKPAEPIIINGTTRGIQHSERGLTYYQIADAGHMIPSDQASLGLEVFKTLIGKGDGSLVHTDGPKGTHQDWGKGNQL